MEQVRIFSQELKEKKSCLAEEYRKGRKECATNAKDITDMRCGLGVLFAPFAILLC